MRAPVGSLATGAPIGPFLSARQRPVRLPAVVMGPDAHAQWSKRRTMREQKSISRKSRRRQTTKEFSLATDKARGDRPPGQFDLGQVLPDAAAAETNLSTGRFFVLCVRVCDLSSGFRNTGRCLRWREICPRTRHVFTPRKFEDQVQRARSGCGCRYYGWHKRPPFFFLNVSKQLGY